MNTNEFLENVKSALQIKKDIKLNMNLLDLEEWDSLGMVSIIAMFDEKYGKKIDFQELLSMNTVSDLQKAIS